MRLIIAAVGRLKEGSERTLFQRYAGRIGSAGRSCGIGPVSVIEVSESRAGSAGLRQEAEARALIGKLPHEIAVVVLECGGKTLDSAGFARSLATWRQGGADALAFVIGGPDGLGGALRARANGALSLGAMTLPHGLARIVLAEQLYRALTILTGHPYHRG